MIFSKIGFVLLTLYLYIIIDSSYHVNSFNEADCEKVISEKFGNNFSARDCACYIIRCGGKIKEIEVPNDDPQPDNPYKYVTVNGPNGEPLLDCSDKKELFNYNNDNIYKRFYDQIFDNIDYSGIQKNITDFCGIYVTGNDTTISKTDCEGRVYELFISNEFIYDAPKHIATNLFYGLYDKDIERNSLEHHFLLKYIVSYISFHKSFSAMDVGKFCYEERIKNNPQELNDGTEQIESSGI